MTYRNYDAEDLRLEIAVARATNRIMAMVRPFNGSLPPDPRTGGYEDEDGNWIEYFKVGMTLGSAPLRPEQD